MLRTFVSSIVFYPLHLASILLDPMLMKKFQLQYDAKKKKKRKEKEKCTENGINGIRKKVYAVSLLSRGNNGRKIAFGIISA